MAAMIDSSIHHGDTELTECVSLFCPIGRLACQRLEAQLMAGRSRSAKRTLPFGHVHFDLLSDLGWRDDYPMHGFARTQHTTQGNPAPRSGAEDFGLPPKSPRQAKDNTLTL